MEKEIYEETLASANILKDIMNAEDEEIVSAVGAGFLFAEMIRMTNAQDDGTISENDSRVLKYIETLDENDMFLDIENDIDGCWNELPDFVKDWFIDRVTVYSDVIIRLFKRYDEHVSKEEI